MVLTCAVKWLLSVSLLSVGFEVDGYFRFKRLGTRLEVPATDCVLGGSGEKRMAGFDLCLRDGSAWLNRNQQNDGSADMHSAGEFGINRGDAGDNGPLNSAGNCRSGAEEEASCKENGTGRSE
jgi:hypothetical protein